MHNRSWLERFQTLLARLSYLELDAGIAAPSLVAAWGVYCLLRRLAGEE